MKIKLLPLLGILSLFLSSAYCEYIGSAHVIKGKAEVKVENLFSCENGNSRPSPLGIQTLNGKEFVVPAHVQYE